MTDLNAKVTAAVLHAESVANDAEASDLAKDAAYWELAKAEEELAATLPATSLEGIVARKGAVRAAILGRKYASCSRLISEYLHEAHVTPEMVTWLTAVLDRAEPTDIPGY